MTSDEGAASTVIVGQKICWRGAVIRGHTIPLGQVFVQISAIKFRTRHLPGIPLEHQGESRTVLILSMYIDVGHHQSQR